MAGGKVDRRSAGLTWQCKNMAAVIALLALAPVTVAEPLSHKARSPWDWSRGPDATSETDDPLAMPVTAVEQPETSSSWWIPAAIGAAGITALLVVVLVNAGHTRRSGGHEPDPTADPGIADLKILYQ